MAKSKSKPPAPFFHARATYVMKRNQYYRIYCRPTELLFVECGPGKIDNFAAGAAVGGGAVGWLIGSYIAGRAAKKTEVREKLLDEADDEELERLVEDGKNSFRADVGEFTDICIDPKSVWHQITYSSPNHVGLLRFHHHERGKMKLEFLSNDDLSMAINILPELLPQPVSVNVVWNEKKKAFVKA